MAIGFSALRLGSLMRLTHPNIEPTFMRGTLNERLVAGFSSFAEDSTLSFLVVALVADVFVVSSFSSSAGRGFGFLLNEGAGIVGILFRAHCEIVAQGILGKRLSFLESLPVCSSFSSESSL